MRTGAWILRKVRNEYGKAIRKAYESHEVTERRANMTSVEPRTDGISNTITTVQKDNYLLETNLYDTASVAVEDNEQVVDVYNKKVLKGSVCGTITAHGNASPTTCGTFGVIEKGEKELQNDTPKEIRIVNPDGTVRTELINPDNKAQMSQMDDGDKETQQIRYRIRKLTPRECWQLMDFSDEDFDKAETVNSNTQLYKQAGNSIVVNVLAAIMGQMFAGKEGVYREHADQKFFNQNV